MPRLKVFRAHLGFYDAIVAAPSQKAAIAAWGAPKSEFRKGFASVTDDPDAVEAAMARPGVVLRRPFGSKETFSVEPAKPVVKRSGRSAVKKDSTAQKKAAADRRRLAERQIAKRELNAKLEAILEQEKQLAKARDAARSDYKSRLKRAQ